MSLYISEADALLFRDTRPMALFFHMTLTTDTALRLWMGVNDIPSPGWPIGSSAIDSGGETYTGAGKLINLPEFEALINGIADRVTFSLSGVDDETAARLDEGAPEVRGAAVYVGLAAMNAAYQPITDIIGLFTGTADYWSMQQTVVQGEGQPARTALLSVGAGDTGRTRPVRAAYTQTQQQALYPDDTFCRRVFGYSRGYITKWPRF